MAQPAAWRSALRREATAMAAIRHPNVAQVYAFGRHGDLPYFVMEWIDGESLGREIEERRAAGRPMSLRRALWVCGEACRGLQAVHGAGLVHRDVKPQNFMIAKNGRVVLIDFGLVRLPDGSGPMGSPVGTPRYMAPELAESPMASAAEWHLADIYSLGATMYEVLTLTPPFLGEGAHEVIERHRHEPVSPPSLRRRDLPPFVDRLLLRALAKAPRERYLSCDDMRAAVSAVAAGLGTPSASAPRVLIVDDDAEFRAALCGHLQRLLPGARLYTAACAGDAVATARQVAPHLAVLNVRVPSPGLDLACALSSSAETEHTRVMIISDEIARAVRAKLESVGVACVFEKPLQPARFIEAVRQVLLPAA